MPKLARVWLGPPSGGQMQATRPHRPEPSRPPAEPDGRQGGWDRDLRAPGLVQSTCR